MSRRAFVFCLLGMKRRAPADLRKQAEQLLRRHSPQWMAIDGVVACGVGLSDERNPRSVVIKIYVRRLNLPSLRRLPKKVDSIPIVVEEGGEIKALPTR
ncbi:MAG: hypothetical protein HY644_07375 [Acidobacteria bacterium]|nr:hypothetical protein [Acidobacteriota bacterium]